MPANKYACAHVNAAYARMLHVLSEAETPAFSLFPTADQFEDAKQHLDNLAHAVDDYIHAIAVEANSNATVHISTKDRAGILSGALNDCDLLADLQSAADTHREDAEERALERALERA